MKNTEKSILDIVLSKSRSIPKEVKFLPQKQQNAIREYINNGYVFKEIIEVRSAYNRLYKYAILISIDGEQVTVNKNGNNRTMYGY